MTFIVGLTGGIGCGKSTIEKLFTAYGVSVIDADLITHKLQQPGQAGYEYIKEYFGDSYINLDGSLNRAMLRKTVFNNKESKEKLEMIMSPIIYHEVKRQLEERALYSAFNETLSKYIILTVPLLLESKKFTKLVDRILVIDCPESIQTERVMARSGLAKREVEKIIASQLPRSLRILKGDDVIHNYDCNPEDTSLIVKELHNRYMSLAEEKSILSSTK
jgi:dephospho-CoA kinase